MTADPKMKVLTCKVTEDIHRKVKILAAKRGKTMSEVLEDFVKVGLFRLEKVKKVTFRLKAKKD
jgi:hypothetical protein